MEAGPFEHKNAGSKSCQEANFQPKLFFSPKYNKNNSFPLASRINPGGLLVRASW
jgi:hypothetical protein